MKKIMIVAAAVVLAAIGYCGTSAMLAGTDCQPTLATSTDTAATGLFDSVVSDASSAPSSVYLCADDDASSDESEEESAPEAEEEQVPGIDRTWAVVQQA
jgi:hypothetical protein